MDEIVEKGRDDAKRRRVLLGAAATCLMSVPWLAMQLTEEVVWEVGDFVVFGALLAGVAAAFELVASESSHRRTRAAFGVALLAAFLLVWVNLGVGIIGAEGDPANLMFAGVIAVGVVGAFRARFRPDGMAAAMGVTALAQMLAGIAALAAGWGSSANAWPRDVVGATVFFTALWLLSAWLFVAMRRSVVRRE